jgi:hypothetical protein
MAVLLGGVPVVLNFVPHVNREISQQDLPYTIDLINPVVVFLIICRQSLSSKKQKKKKKKNQTIP